MVKKNLFSKVIAGIGALAMVVTMLPGISLRAEARTTAFTLRSMKDLDHTAVGADARHYSWAYLGTDASVVTTGEDPEVHSDEVAVRNVLASDAGKDIYLLWWPDKYYEFASRPTAPALYDEGNRNSDVWVGDGSNNRCEIYDNPKYPGTYIVKIPSDKLEDGALADNLWIDFTEATKEVVTVTIRVGEGVTANVVSNPTRTIEPGKEFTYHITIDDSATAADPKVLVEGIAAATNYWNLDNKVPIAGVRSAVAADDVDADVTDTPGEYVVTTISATDSAGISVKAGKTYGSTGALTMTVNGKEYAKSDLVQRLIEFPPNTGTTPLKDQMAYVQVATPDATAGTLGTDKLTYPSVSDANYNVTEFAFNVWFTNIFNLYFEGYADNTGTAGEHRVIRTNKNAAYKNTVIEIGTALRDGNVVFRNGEELTAQVGLASKYNRALVFRDENGNRFDPTVYQATDSYSGDPAYYWIGKQKEGGEYKFTVEVDPMYKKLDTFGVWMVPVTDTTGNGGPTKGSAVELKPDENGVYTAKFGGDFPYAIYANGIDEKSGKELREVVNQPEADSIYAPGAHNERQYQLMNRYPFYANTMFLNLRANSTCNVANPRYMLYLEANEEDTDLVEVFPFAIPRAVATKDNAFIGTDFPMGEYKFKVRFSNNFVSAQQHGTFDDTDSNDRYAEGKDFKVTIDGETVTKDANGLYTLKVTEGEDPIVIKVDGIATAYKVYAPNVAAYDIEANVPMNREMEDNFVSTVVGGEKYRFKINLDEGVTKGPNFKVELAQPTDIGSYGDYANDVVRTQIPQGADGWYEFTVNNDTQIIISGIIGGEGFSDTSNRSDEEQEAINYLKDAGVLEGYDDGSFRPGNNLTRGEFVTMLQRLQKGTAGTASFSDTSGHWAAGAIGWASGQSVVNGYPDGSFRPNASISRAEVSQIMWKLNGSQRANMVAPFSDVSQGAWYAPAVNWNFEKGIIKGYGDGKFGTNEPIERAHMALILYRAR